MPARDASLRDRLFGVPIAIRNIAREENYVRTKFIKLSLVAIFVLYAGGRGTLAHGDGVRQPSAIDEVRSRLTTTDSVMVVAHRACWRLAPENSIKSIEACIRLGVDMVEIDVRKTSDGQLVVIHDDTVDRTTDGNGSVSDFSLDELSRLRLKAGLGGDAAPLTDQHVPTLAQALAVAKGRILVNLDAKSDVRNESYRLAKEMDVSDQILIKMTLTSPHDATLDEAAFFRNTFFMPIVREENGALGVQVASFDPIDPVAFEVIYRTEPQLVQACDAAAAQHARCWVNTMWESLSPGHSDDISVLDPDNHWGYLVDLGVNMFQTDRPRELIRYLGRKGLR